MKEYIERKEVLEIVKRTSGDYATAFCEIRRIPSADVPPVVHGRWELKVESTGPDACDEYWEEAFLVCSECGRREDVDIYAAFSEEWFAEECAKFPYCHCGARMDGGDDNAAD